MVHFCFGVFLAKIACTVTLPGSQSWDAPPSTVPPLNFPRWTPGMPQGYTAAPMQYEPHGEEQGGYQEVPSKVRSGHSVHWNPAFLVHPLPMIPLLVAHQQDNARASPVCTFPGKFAGWLGTRRGRHCSPSLSCAKPVMHWRLGFRPSSKRERCRGRGESSWRGWG